jgi:FlaA1/EpsC-like NDP-sugar epimerase
MSALNERATSGPVEFSEVELEALLQRPLRRLLTPADCRAIAGRRVLITGAGGSIGSELARRIACCKPARLTLIDQSELNLFQIERELNELAPGVRLDVVLGDVSETIDDACVSTRPHVVYHTAAYKHVTMLERAVCSAVKANVLGTIAAVEAARIVGARFVFISTDKAASPRSVMGASKRLGELMVMARASAWFRPIVVRFGTVLGSSGSVLSIMRERIRRGRAIPMTDPSATRSFMTVGEAASLVIKADLLSRRSETYWLDMGAPVTIGDLAERLMAIESAAGFARVGTEIVGLRPSETLREELTTQGLRMCRTNRRRIWVARQTACDGLAMARAEVNLRRAVDGGDAAAALDVLSAAVPEFVPSPEARGIAEAQRVKTSSPFLQAMKRTA